MLVFVDGNAFDDGMLDECVRDMDVQNLHCLLSSERDLLVLSSHHIAHVERHASVSPR